MNWAEVGRFLVVAGSVVIVVGMILMISDKLPVGRLPGDLQFGSGRFRIYIPVTTSILISILITVVVNFFSRR
jgi:hypothetical protein